MDFGTRLLKELELVGMRQAELAERLGVQRQAVTNWIKGGKPSRENLATMEEILGLRRGELLAMFDYRHPDEEPAAVAVTPEEAIRLDPTMANEDKRTLLHIIAGFRRAFARVTGESPSEPPGNYDIDRGDPGELTIWEQTALPEDERWRHVLRYRRHKAELDGRGRRAG